jgi:hypothetical protein
MNKTDIGYRIADLRGDETFGAFAARIGVSESWLQLLMDEKSPPLEQLISFARRAEVSVAWLVTGEGPMKIEQGADVPGEDIVFVPWLRAYRGKHDPTPQEKRVPLAFPRVLLAGLSKEIDTLRIASVSGDAMVPTLSERGLVLIDTVSDEFVDDGVYAFLRGDDLVFRRVQRRLVGGTNLLCDNPRYRDEDLPVEERGYVEAAGRVVWHAARL